MGYSYTLGAAGEYTQAGYFCTTCTFEGVVVYAVLTCLNYQLMLLILWYWYTNAALLSAPAWPVLVIALTVILLSPVLEHVPAWVHACPLLLLAVSIPTYLYMSCPPNLSSWRWLL